MDPGRLSGGEVCYSKSYINASVAEFSYSSMQKKHHDFILMLLIYSVYQSVLIVILASLLLFVVLYVGLLFGILYYLYGPPLADMQNVEDIYLKNPKEHFWVAEIPSGQIVGTIAIVYKSQEVAWLRRMAVKPGYNGLGIGKSLVKTAVDFCQRHGYSHIELITTEIHHAARNLYTKFGFETFDYKPVPHLGGLIHIWTFWYRYNLLEKEVCAVTKSNGIL